jgi:hypothetical protein
LEDAAGLACHPIRAIDLCYSVRRYDEANFVLNLIPRFGQDHLLSREMAFNGEVAEIE